MKRLACLSVMLLTLGLACARPAAAPIIVKEPVPVPCPQPEIPARPALPSAGLPADPGLDSLLKALLADREILAAWALDLERRLKAYLAPETKETP